MSEHPELHEHPEWRQTGNAYFPVAARVHGRWWVLRINSFPDHALWTLFVDGERRFDIDDAPDPWGNPAAETHPSLNDRDRDDALAPVKAFVAYGSEVGEPCENPYCCG